MGVGVKSYSSNNLSIMHILYSMMQSDGNSLGDVVLDKILDQVREVAKKFFF